MKYNDRGPESVNPRARRQSARPSNNPASNRSDHPGREADASHPNQAASPFEMLCPALRRGLREMGYETPTPIQNECIPRLLQGVDLLGSAQTGTGKTAAFLLPLMHRVQENPRSPGSRGARVLVLAPTRELALQIHDSLRAHGAHLKLRHAVVFGGVGQDPQIRALRQGVDFLIATPGRLLDLIGQGHLRLDGVEAFVLDEADRMLDMGFIRDVRRIVSLLPARRQGVFFSATVSDEARALAGEILTRPERVAVAPEKTTLDTISQRIRFVNETMKRPALLALLEDSEATRVIVFAGMKHVANRLSKMLNDHGIQSAAIHGNKSQSARVKALRQFRDGALRVLVATDVAARGIDVADVTHVINYQLPKEPETYVHRIGRTARAGGRGHAISLCSHPEREWLGPIERLLRKPIPVDADHAHHVSFESAGKDSNASRALRPDPTKRSNGRPRRGARRPGAASNRGGGGARRSRRKVA